MDDVYDELDELEQQLRNQAAQLQQMAAGMRDAAKAHDGKALGLIEAADRLRKIERPE